MSIAIVTGSSGSIGSETVKFLHEKGLRVIGFDNNMRKYFFGEDGSTESDTHHLKSTLRDFTHVDVDIREQEAIFRIFRRVPKEYFPGRAHSRSTQPRLGRQRTIHRFQH